MCDWCLQDMDGREGNVCGPLCQDALEAAREMPLSTWGVRNMWLESLCNQEIKNWRQDQRKLWADSNQFYHA